MNVTTLVRKLKSLVVVKKNSSLPSLHNVLIESTLNTLTFTTTDLDTTTSISIHSGYTNFTAVVNYRTLLSILASVPKKTEISFTVEANNFIIHSVIGDFPLPTISRDSYPSLPTLPETLNTMPIEVANQMNSLLPFVAGASEIRASLTGVFYDNENNTLVATDGHYMSLYKNIPTLLENDKNVIIPTPAIKHLTKLLKSSNDYGKKCFLENIEIGVKGIEITFKGTDFTVIARTIEGPYPPYYKVIPAKSDLTITLDKTILMNLPKECMNSYTKQVMLECNENTVTYYLENNDGNKWSAKGGTATFEGYIAFNANLLQDVAKFVGNDPLVLHVVDAITAVLYDDADRSSLIMPVRLPDNI